MARILEITHEDIKKLNGLQLTELLLRLLYLEAARSNLPKSSVSGSLNITVSDDGEDARIKWSEGPNLTNWIPNRFTLFQSKAQDMTNSKCRKELLVKNKNQLKPGVEEVLSANGSYILFYNRDCNTKHEKIRIAHFRKGIENARKPYAKTADIHIYDATAQSGKTLRKEA